MLIFQMGKLSQGPSDLLRAMLGAVMIPLPLVLLLLYHTLESIYQDGLILSRPWVLQHILTMGHLSNPLTTRHKNVGSDLGFGFFTHQL